MTELSSFLHREEFTQIRQELEKACLQKSACSFNAFSLSSYNTHYENFHSDIIKAILDPQGVHNEGNLFLELFIEFLNVHYNLKLNIADYIDSNVERENGRIDVGIRNWESSKAIIIENKINNAPDMDNQLLRYYNNCIDSGLQVELIIYLSMDGLKKAPLFNEIKCNKDIAAFSNSPNDLATGWLDKCIMQSSNPNSKSLLNEYYKLLQHLNGQAMENNASNIFYEVINEENGLSTVENIVRFYNELPRYRMDNLVKKIDKNYQPFIKQYRYKSNYQLYENYVDGIHRFKLDIWFEQNGTANIVFWDGNSENWKEETRTIVQQKLKSINMLEEFAESHYGSNGYFKTFTISEYVTLKKIDDAVFDFVTRLFKSLQQK
jgi:prepilin-type processing-associated H-X9-DG protein